MPSDNKYEHPKGKPLLKKYHTHLNSVFGTSDNLRRTKFQIEQDRMEIAKLYLQGYTQNEIADILYKSRGYKLSQQIISRDLQAVRQAWINSYLVDFNELKSKELARIDALERAYWEGYLRSCQSKTVTSTQVMEDSGGKPKTSASKIEEQRDGDVRFLQGIQWCIEKRCRIFGFDAPRKSDVSINWREEAIMAGVKEPDKALDELVESFVAAAKSGMKKIKEDDGFGL